MRRSPLNKSFLGGLRHMNFATSIKSALSKIIDNISANPTNYVKNPMKDFVRKRKLDLSTTINIILSLSNKSSQDELLDFFSHDYKTPSLSALIQQRDKISDTLFPTILSEFNAHVSSDRLYKGYRLLACDGTDINIFHNPNDASTYYRNPGTEKGFNELHVDALYDIYNRYYLRINIDGRHDQNEQRAMAKFISDYEYDSKTVFIADRNYECWNVMAHAQEKNVCFLIRAKDICSNGVLRSFRLDENIGSFDLDLPINLVRSKRCIDKSNPLAYRTMASNVKFDFLPKSTPGAFLLKMRAVRFLISPDRYEVVLTNLPRNLFSPDDIKKLYSMRWGIETSFRELKHALSLNDFHSKKVEHIHQEIFAKVIMYNFCSAITMHVEAKHKKKKYIYQINFSRAIKECKHFFISNAEAPPNVEAVIQKYMLPIRLGRTNPRKVKIREKNTFLYR